MNKLFFLRCFLFLAVLANTHHPPLVADAFFACRAAGYTSVLQTSDETKPSSKLLKYRYRQSSSRRLYAAIKEDNVSETRKKNTKKQTEGKSVCLARVVAINALTVSTSQQTNKHNHHDGDFATRRLEQDPTYQTNLDQRDRSFARLLVATVERRMGQIDKLLTMAVDKKYPPKAGPHSARIAACLRVGVAQLVFLQTPSYAAIQETVQTLRFGKKKDTVP